MVKKVKHMDLEDEREERGKYAGLTKEEIEIAASAIRSQKEKSSELSGTLSGKLGVFEKKGGHKSALKMATRISGLGPAECADFMRAFNAYFDALGGNDQLDMFAQASENDKNSASIAAASMAMPEIGEEAAIN